MISICIPIHNRDISLLLTDLYRQCINLEFNYEILLIDDASEYQYKQLNKKVVNKINNKQIVYEELPINIGRSRIRNRLAERALFPFLLFIDNDAKICSPNFISRYIAIIKPGIICYGGCCYEECNDNSLRLRWLYGKKREAIPADLRQESADYHFSGFNFLIDKRIILLHPFDENIMEYGYEDLLFSIQLVKQGFKIVQIENPLIHDGLITNKEFIIRTEIALDNLNKIQTSQIILQSELLYHIKILNTAYKINKWKMVKPTAWAYKLLKKIFRKNLLSNNPSLLVFDLYKLGYLCNLKNNDKLC